MNKSLTLSIVIPVYNEERYLKHCLDAIAKQTVKPDEVIVVDNNSTDRSLEIAKDFDFVTILKESRQHQIFAQKTGFDHAESDIIARIDADTMLPEYWVKNVKHAFEHNSDFVAITGGALPYDVKLQSFSLAVFNFYNWLASKIASTRMLWGANCALRRQVWQQISPEVHLRPDIWEDQDLSFHLEPYGKIKKLKNINVGTSFRAVHASFFMQVRYQFRSVRTFYLHHGFLVATIYGLLWGTMLPIFLVVLVDSYILKPLAHFKEPY